MRSYYNLFQHHMHGVMNGLRLGIPVSLNHVMREASDTWVRCVDRPISCLLRENLTLSGQQGFLSVNGQ